MSVGACCGCGNVLGLPAATRTSGRSHGSTSVRTGSSVRHYGRKHRKQRHASVPVAPMAELGGDRAMCNDRNTAAGPSGSPQTQGTCRGCRWTAFACGTGGRGGGGGGMACLLARAVDVFAQLLLELREVDVKVGRLAQDRLRAAELAAGVAQLGRVEQRPAVVTLVASGVLVAALGAGADDVAVREELVEREGVELLVGALHEVAVIVDAAEDALCDLRLCSACHGGRVVGIPRRCSRWVRSRRACWEGMGFMCWRPMTAMCLWQEGGGQRAA